MPEAIRLATQQRNDGEIVSALDAARELGLAVMASAPLMQARLTRDLPAQVRALFPAARTDAQRALAFVRSLPGLTTALVGMKQPAHLAENLESARR
jgi:aryl-alcohol dehydrogenase-like predicted oxidoreductase